MPAQELLAPLRVGYLLQNNGPDLSTLSGPQLHTTAVIHGLQKLGHTVRTVAIQQEQLGWSDTLDGWQQPRYGCTASGWFRLIERPVRRLQRELRLPYFGLFESIRFADAAVQLLHDYQLLYERHGYMGFGGILAARWLGVPIVLELNGNILKEMDELAVPMSPLQRTIGRWITHWSYRTADHLVVVSEALKEMLVKEVGVDETRISVVLNGVDLEIFQQPYDSAAVRRQFAIEERPTVAFVGSFQPWHGVDLLVASFQHVLQAFPAAQLLLIGAGAGYESIVRQIDDLGIRERVRLLGRQPQANVAALLSVADVLVAPYPFEHSDIVGTPLKLLEYMAVGKVIVASTAPIHDILQDGVNGIRVTPANAAALAAGLVRALRDPELRTQLASNATALVQGYSWKHVALRLSDLFRAEIARRIRPIQSRTNQPATQVR